MNLKQAARRLGVHYQTAYRYVRDGSLAAVRVGCTYEISEPAIEQFIAQCEAARRVPLTERGPEQPHQFVSPLRSLLADVRAAYDAMTLSPVGVFDVVAEGLARVVGDLVVVRTVSEDLCLHPCAIAHRDPRRLSIAWTQADTFAPTATESHERVAIMTGKALLIRHVPQDQLRAHTPPEFVQFLDEGSAHSLVCVPAIHDRRVRAVITLTRDLPCGPYTSDDVAAVEKFACFVGAAIARSSAAQAAWCRRRVLMASVSELGSDVTTATHARDLIVPDGSAELICDVNGRILCANRAVGTFGGIDATTLIGTQLHDLIVDEEQPRELKLLSRLMTGELAFADTERTVVTDYGDRVRFAVHRGVARNAASEPVALVVVADPIPDPEERIRIWSAAS